MNVCIPPIPTPPSMYSRSLQALCERDPAETAVQ